MSRVEKPPCAEPSPRKPEGAPGNAELAEVTEQDRQAFEDLLLANGDSAQQGQSGGQDHDGSNPDFPATALVEEPTPFSLFGVRTNALAGVAPTTPPARLTRELTDIVQRMLISDGTHGARQVQVQLKDAVLPGVMVSVAEQQGGVVFDFHCLQAGSRRRLETWSRRLTDELGKSLGRHVRVSVQGADEADAAGAGP